MIQEDMKSLCIELPEDVLRAKWCGDFERAQRLIDVRLADERTPDSQRTRLRLEKEILDRMPLDFTYSMEEAVQLVQKDIPDFSMEELNRLMDTGSVEWIYIHGKPVLANRFYETLRKVDPSISRRAGGVADFEEDPEVQMLNRTIRQMQEQGGVCRHIHLKATLQIKDAYFKPGKVRVHIPVPARAVNMRNIQVLGAEPEAIMLSEEGHPQRTIYFEETMTENHPFCVEYAYDCLALEHELDPDKVITEPLTFDTQEEMPHIRFTPTIRALCEELRGGEKNPLLIARRFYDFCTTKVKYSFMREYFTITEIPEYAALNLKGDCGVQALLFITLCRYAGIPARWQSGLYVTPEEAGMHDWAQFYIAPYGWLFADPSFGGSAYRSGNLERWNHYFGNLDPYRRAANSAFQHVMDPVKRQRRQDPYDNQSGEAEYEEYGLVRSQLQYSWEILEHTERDRSEMQ